MKLGKVFETEKHYIKKVQYTDYVRRGKGVGTSSKIGYVIYNSDNTVTEQDNKGYFISGFKFKTKKAAVEVITALEA